MTVHLRHSFRLLLCLALGLAIHLHAATAADILGNWTVDGAATWEAMKDSPKFATIPADKRPVVQEMMVKQLSTATFTFTNTTIASAFGDKQEEASYKILATDAEKLTVEVTDQRGKVQKHDFIVTGDTLTMANLDEPGMVMVLKRAAK